MNVRKALLLCSKLLKAKAKSDPESTVRVDTETMKCAQVAKQIEDMADLVYTKLDTKNIRIVVMCDSCKHCKRYRKGHGQKIKRMYMCQKYGVEVKPDFWCKDGEEKNAQNIPE